MRRPIPQLIAFLMLGAVFAIPPVQQPSSQQQSQTKEQNVYMTKTRAAADRDQPSARRYSRKGTERDCLFLWGGRHAFFD
jgi:hypothetical protein